jgi:DNA-directed RNA polymerase specialized sigma24 family protein
MTASDVPPTDPTGGDRYGYDEIREAIEGLSDADFGRVRLMARYFSQRSGTAEDDLLQETFVRALGSRSCRAGTNIIGFLGGVMKSIASEGPRAKKRPREKEGGGFELVFIGEFGTDGIAAAADQQSPEDAALSSLYHHRALERALACLDGDEELQLLAEGLFDNMRGKELESLLGTDTKGLAAAQKRLSRRLRATFPQGVDV